jgi:hypothetical protein
VSTAFPVNVAEVTLVKQADCLPHGSANRHNLRDNILERSKLAKHACEGHKVGWEIRILALKVTTGIENTRNRPIWYV